MQVKITLCLSMLLSLMCLAGCPHGQVDQSQAGTTPADSAHSGLPAQSDGQQVSGNPDTTQSPTGDIWLKLKETTVGVNQPATVEYSLVPAPNGDAWIALVPAAIESQALQDNIKHVVDRVTLPSEATGTVELVARKPGTYAIRMFPAQVGEVMAIAETAVTYTDEPVNGELVFTPPYVTITSRELQEIPEQYIGRPMIAYWELEEAPGDQAWIGMIPTSCAALDAKSNLEAAVDIQYLGGETKDRSIFFLNELGEYHFRIFPSEDDEAQMLCESQVFRAINRPDKQAEKTE